MPTNPETAVYVALIGDQPTIAAASLEAAQAHALDGQTKFQTPGRYEHRWDDKQRPGEVWRLMERRVSKGARFSWTVRSVHAVHALAPAVVSSPPATDRATVLREAIDVAREEGHRLEAEQGVEAARGARSVAYLLRKLLVKADMPVDWAVVAYRSPGTRALYCVICARQETGWQPLTADALPDGNTACDFCGGRVLAVASRTLGDVVARYVPAVGARQPDTETPAAFTAAELVTALRGAGAERDKVEQAALDRVRTIVRRLAAHAVGFQDVLDESDRGPWGRTVGADIAELCAALDAQPELRLPHHTVNEEEQPEPDLADRLEAALTERFTELGNPFSEMRRHEQGPDGWPASHPVGPAKVAEVLRELLDAAAGGAGGVANETAGEGGQSEATS